MKMANNTLVQMHYQIVTRTLTRITKMLSSFIKQLILAKTIFIFISM